MEEGSEGGEWRRRVEKASGGRGWRGSDTAHGQNVELGGLTRYLY